MEELITKKIDVEDNFKYELDGDFNFYNSIFLSKPITLRIWASFFVILPIFVQAPWVRFEPISALCFTFVIVLVAIVLNQKGSNTNK